MFLTFPFGARRSCILFSHGICCEHFFSSLIYWCHAERLPPERTDTYVGATPAEREAQTLLDMLLLDMYVGLNELSQGV